MFVDPEVDADPGLTAPSDARRESAHHLHFLRCSQKRGDASVASPDPGITSCPSSLEPHGVPVVVDFRVRRCFWEREEMSPSVGRERVSGEGGSRCPDSHSHSSCLTVMHQTPENREPAERMSRPFFSRFPDPSCTPCTTGIWLQDERHTRGGRSTGCETTACNTSLWTSSATERTNDRTESRSVCRMPVYSSSRRQERGTREKRLCVLMPLTLQSQQVLRTFDHLLEQQGHGMLADLLESRVLPDSRD